MAPRIAHCALLLGLGSVSGYALGATDAPKDNQGYTTPKTVVLDLGKEIEGMAGWQLRLRMLNIAPGGRIGLHNHKDRPASANRIIHSLAIRGKSARPAEFLVRAACWRASSVPLAAFGAINRVNQSPSATA
jgi:hypothetical protein